MRSARTARVAFVPVSILACVGTLSGIAPAAAAARDTLTTTTVALPDATVVDFQTTIDIQVDVDSQGGSTPTEGTTTLYAMEAGDSTWQAVTTNDSASSDFLAVRPWMTTSYKVVYNGHSAAGAGDGYATSESEPFTVQVRRAITYPRGGFVVEGRVTPRYGQRRIVIKASREQSSGYVRFRAITTDRRGRYAVTLPRRKGTWYWSFRVSGDASYLPTSFQWKTWVSVS